MISNNKTRGLHESCYEIHNQSSITHNLTLQVVVKRLILIVPHLILKCLYLLHLSIIFKKLVMKKMYILLFTLSATLGFSQTVTTFLNSPEADIDDALALDSQGNLYGSNYFGGVVYKVAPDGQAATFVSGLVNANGLAVDSEDNVYVAEYGNGTINKYDNKGNVLHIFPIPSGLPSGLIKTYKKETVIFTNADFVNPDNNSVNELRADGSVKVLYQGAPLSVPVGLTYGPGGDLYIGNYLDRKIFRLPADGSPLEYVATVPAPDNFVPFLAFITYSQGFLYGTVYGENKIYKINPRNVDDVEIYSGSVFGAADGHISEATYAFPSGILANKSGNTLYVSEFSGIGNVRKITNGNGVANRSTSNISAKVHPNPASDVIIVSAASERTIPPVNIQIYSLVDGTLLKEKTHVKLSDGYTMSVSDLPVGLYELVVTGKDFRKHITVAVSR